MAGSTVLKIWVDWSAVGSTIAGVPGSVRVMVKGEVILASTFTLAATWAAERLSTGVPALVIRTMLSSPASRSASMAGRLAAILAAVSTTEKLRKSPCKAAPAASAAVIRCDSR